MQSLNSLFHVSTPNDLLFTELSHSFQGATIHQHPIPENHDSSLAMTQQPAEGKNLSGWHWLSNTHTDVIFTYTLLSVTDMASSVKASLDTSLSLVLLTGAKEPAWQGLIGSPLLYDLGR